TLESGAYGSDAPPGGPPAGAYVASLWAVIDPAAQVVPLSATSTYAPGSGWFKGLIFSYFDGGKLPLNSSGAVLSMEAVVVDPVGTGSSALTADRVIIFPFGPDD